MHWGLDAAEYSDAVPYFQLKSRSAAERQNVFEFTTKLIFVAQLALPHL
jgi:hypothetical protein